MRRRTWYELLAGGTLAIAAGSVILAAAGAAVQEALSATAASLCAALFGIPGLYFLAYARRLRVRDVALAHVAVFAGARGTVDLRELADELHVSRDDAEKMLRIAVREGHLRGAFDDRGRFVTQPSGPGGGTP